ncbi:MAG: ion transporter [Candidatus Taylorbacteria bacterium]|nr:ion transporter [Candidatus Taylorbacteria bacterium]
MASKHIQSPQPGFLDNPESRLSLRINKVLALVTILSILGFVLETVPSLASYHTIFAVVEYTVAAIFTVEYVIRLVTEQKRWNYIFSFYGLVDIAAILPTYLGLGNLTPLKAARAIRILRFLRLLRLLKITRMHGMRQHTDVDSVYKLNIQIYLVAVFTSLVMLGSALYLSERTQSAFASIPASMFWVTHIILGGEPFASPQTGFGMGVELLVRFVGLILFGFLIHIVGSFVNSVLLGTKVDKSSSVRGEEA